MDRNWSQKKRWTLAGIAAASFVVLTQLGTRSDLTQYHKYAICLLTGAMVMSIAVLYHEQLKGRPLVTGFSVIILTLCTLMFFLGMLAFIASFGDAVVIFGVIAAALAIILIEADQRLSKKHRKPDPNEASKRGDR